MNEIEKNWDLIQEKVIKPMYENGEFPLTLADIVSKALEQQKKESDELDYWKREAISATAKLGEIRIWMAEIHVDLDEVLVECKDKANGK